MRAAPLCWPRLLLHSWDPPVVQMMCQIYGKHGVRAARALLLWVVSANIAQRRTQTSDQVRTLADEEVGSTTTTKKISAKNMATGSLGKVKMKPKADSKGSDKAQKVKIAAKGAVQTAAASRTNAAEVWLPLQNAGSGARVLVKLQGVLSAEHPNGRPQPSARCRCDLAELPNFCAVKLWGGLRVGTKADLPS